MISNEVANAVREGKQVTLVVPSEHKQLLLDAQEQIQNDLQCILDGLVKDHVLTNACQAVVDRFKPLFESVGK